MLPVISAWRRECSLLHVTAVSLALVEYVLDFGRRCTVIFGAHCVGHEGRHALVCGQVTSFGLGRASLHGACDFLWRGGPTVQR